MKKHFTIGMAGHIDHGKTSLTKALTNVDTDRLKEEKERQISIELGFAPLIDNDELEVSIIDVPGHERFIRQMIAGVSGINLVILVVAADEGVMPQTKEHLEILQFLGVKKGIVVLTKIDKVEPDFLELVQAEISLELEGSLFAKCPLITVDSITKKGIDDLRSLIVEELNGVEPNDFKGAFRLPIDQVFSVKGHGTVVRGTVYNGSLKEGDPLFVFPEKIETKARQLQVHNKSVSRVYAGQRAAVNLANISNEEIIRGDVLVSSNDFQVTSTIDVTLSAVKHLSGVIKQRMPIKCFIGTSEVMGKIVFFDRNELGSENDEVLCQLRLEHKVVAQRGDRFILRRPSPAETLGGGWVIDPGGEKYRFGQMTIEALTKKKEGRPADRLIDVIKREKGIKIELLVKEISISSIELEEVVKDPSFIPYKTGYITHSSVIDELHVKVLAILRAYEEENSLRHGIKKAELVSELHKNIPRDLLEYVIEDGENKGSWHRYGQYISSADFLPHIPTNWRKRTESMISAIYRDGLKVRSIKEYFIESGLPGELEQDLIRFLLDQNTLIKLDEHIYVHSDAFSKGVQLMRERTAAAFEVGTAKDILGLSRKHIIPFLEKLDAENYTKREGNKRVWINANGG